MPHRHRHTRIPTREPSNFKKQDTRSLWLHAPGLRISILKMGIGIESEKVCKQVRDKSIRNKLEIKKAWKQIKD